MDWGALGSRDAVLAICEHFGIDFAQARDHLLARQLQHALELARKVGRAKQRRCRPCSHQTIAQCVPLDPSCFRTLPGRQHKRILLSTGFPRRTAE